MNFILFIVLGLVAGWLASVIMKTDAQQGPLLDIILGMVGAFVGGILMSLVGGAGITGFDLYSLGVATLGAVVLIAVGRMVNRA